MNWEKYISDLKKTSTPRLILYGAVILIILFLLFFKGKKQQGNGDNTGSGTDTQPTKIEVTDEDLEKLGLAFKLEGDGFVILEGEPNYLQTSEEEYEKIFKPVKGYFGDYTIKRKHIFVSDAENRNQKLLEAFKSAFDGKIGDIYRFMEIRRGNGTVTKMIPASLGKINVEALDDLKKGIFRISDNFYFSLNRNIAVELLDFGGVPILCFFNAPTEQPTVDNPTGDFTFFMAILFRDMEVTKKLFKDLDGALMHKMEK